MAYDMVLQTWIIECLKMYKISNKVINLTKVELTARGQTLAEEKIQRSIFQGDLWLFVIAMMPLNYILRKCTEGGGYKFTILQEKINHLIYMDDIKLFAKK